MDEISYDRAEVPVRPEFAESHQRFWDRLASPGTWWTSAERIAIAEEARRAERCRLCDARVEALTPHTVGGQHDRATGLAAPAVEAVHGIVRYASRLTRSWYETLLAQGLTPESYVEIVGTVVALVSIDRFTHGLGLGPHPLPAPCEGAPSRYRPQSAGADEAWVPMVPADNGGTPEADLWPPRAAGNVIRAMSVVPDEVRTLNDLGAVHYVPSHLVRDPRVSRGALTRPQMELVAGRVTALNDCFY
jgi:hypothetical protein